MGKEITSLPPESENKGVLEQNPDHQPESEVKSSSGDEVSEVENTSRAVLQSSLDKYIEQARKNYPHMSAEVIYAVAQNLAIEAEQTTEEYQSSSRDAFARGRAFLRQLKEKKKLERDRRLRGDSY